MPKLINAYAADDTLTNAFADLGKSFLSNTPQLELARQKAFGLSRDNQSYQTLQDAERAGGYDPNDPNVRAAIVGLDKPVEFFQAQRGLTATRYGAADPRATNAYVGAGGAYGGTAQGTREAEANRVDIENLRTQRQFDIAKYGVDTKPLNVIGPNGVPMIAPQSVAIEQRMQPVLGHGDVQGTILQNDLPNLTPDQRAAAGGYAPKLPGNAWVYRKPDGSLGTTLDTKTDAQNGQPITGPVMKLEGADSGPLSPGDAEQSRLRLKAQDNEGVVQLADRILGIVQNDPTVVGPTGNVRRLSQNAIDTLQNVGLLFGDEKKFMGSFQQAQAEAVAKGIDPKLLPGLFDPNASNVVKLNTLLVYKAAAALAGQSGRDLANQDVARMRNLVGDPASWTEGSQAYVNGIQLIKQIAGQERDRSLGVLNTKNITTPGPAAPAPQPAPQPAQAAGMPAGVPPPDQRPVGFSITHPTLGQLIWTGQGWTKPNDAIAD